MEAKITLEYADEKTAEAISNSISPDNFKTPIGLNVETILEKNKVVSHITCESKLSTFIATIDDLLFSASIAEKTLRTINKMR